SVNNLKREHCDVLIIGAGPAGLAFSLSLRQAGLDVRLIERLPASVLADPGYDGRETALSMRSMGILKTIGAWDYIDAEHISPLESALVTDGYRDDANLIFDPAAVGEDQLGCFVANNRIRKALFAAHADHGEAEIIDDAEMATLQASADGGWVRLKDGRTLAADLIVAADSRFSAARRMAGVHVFQHDFHKTMIVSKVHLEQSHQRTAWETFLPGGPVAILPLNQNEASLVLTLAPEEAERLMDLTIDSYLEEANQRIAHRYGNITPRSDRFKWPLIGIYPRSFVLPGFALIGDAALGMHPITAHGYNLGVQGQSILAGHIVNAVRQGRNAADADALAAYQREFRKHSAGMYFSTLAIAELYSHEHLPARMLRGALFDAGRILSPARRLIVKTLTQPMSARS
ncbi:MAG: 5-demethoxyubiquinol-8 5-hydroxylase UbiM, partial [Pseudomonadota bacterium]